MRDSGDRADGRSCIAYAVGNRNRRIPVSVAVCETLAAVEGVDSEATDFRLYDHVEPDAIDRLVENSLADDLCVEFTVGEHLVVVRADGSVVVFA